MIQEKDLEDLIFDSLQSDEGKISLNKRGLKIRESEVNMRYERQLYLAEYGVADIVGVGFDSKQGIIYVHVYELKKGLIKFDALLQAGKYHAAIKHYFSDVFPSSRIKVEIILIGSEIARNEFCYLTDVFENLNVFTVKIGLTDGVWFTKENGYIAEKTNLSYISNETLSDLKKEITNEPF